MPSSQRSPGSCVPSPQTTGFVDEVALLPPALELPPEPNAMIRPPELETVFDDVVVDETPPALALPVPPAALRSSGTLSVWLAHPMTALEIDNNAGIAMRDERRFFTVSLQARLIGFAITRIIYRN